MKLRVQTSRVSYYATVSLTNQVAAKVSSVVQDPFGELSTEESKHAIAWMKLDIVHRPSGHLAAHDPTGTSTALLIEIAM